jgi:hypothetical protein
MKESKKLFKGLGFVGIALCAACCALPIVGVMLGVGTLSVLSAFFEWAGIASLVLALVFFAIYFTRRKKAPSCEVDCGCKPDSNVLTDTKTR